MNAAERNWIVVAGQLLDTVEGGGFELFGPYTEQEALEVCDRIRKDIAPNKLVGLMTVQLLKYPTTARHTIRGTH